MIRRPIAFAYDQRLRLIYKAEDECIAEFEQDLLFVRRKRTYNQNRLGKDTNAAPNRHGVENPSLNFEGKNNLQLISRRLTDKKNWAKSPAEGTEPILRNLSLRYPTDPLRKFSPKKKPISEFFSRQKQKFNEKATLRFYFILFYCKTAFSSWLELILE